MTLVVKFYSILISISLFVRRKICVDVNVILVNGIEGLYNLGAFLPFEDRSPSCSNNGNSDETVAAAVRRWRRPSPSSAQ